MLLIVFWWQTDVNQIIYRVFVLLWRSCLPLINKHSHISVQGHSMSKILNKTKVYVMRTRLHCVTQAVVCFDKHSLILIILGKQHQYTFRNYTHILLALSLHFYSSFLYLLLNSCDGNDATSATWSSASLNISQNVIDEAVGQWKSGYVHAWRWKDITLNIC